jgi:hypothetical protein
VRLTSAVGQLWAVRVQVRRAMARAGRPGAGAPHRTAAAARAPPRLPPPCHFQVGQAVAIEVRLTNDSPEEERVQLSVAAADLAAEARASLEGQPPGGGGGGGPGGGGGAPALARGASTAGGPANPGPQGGADARSGGAGAPSGGEGGGGADGGLLLTGAVERVGLVVPGGGGGASHRLMVLPVRPGLYQLGAADVRSAAADPAAPEPGGGGGSGGGGGAGGAGGGGGAPLYVTQDRLTLLVAG